MEETNRATTIAFLGLGQMGAPMAGRLVSGGFNVRVWNRTRGREDALVAAGAFAATTPAEAAHGANVIITMLTDGSTVEAVMNGADGVLSQSHQGALWLQMSTVGVEWTQRLHDIAVSKGVTFVDAPVSGSVAPATSGQLLILASGPDEAQTPATPIFDLLGRRTVWLGSAGAGSSAKLVLNNWLADLVEMVVETLKFSEKLGLDPHAIVDILDDVPIGSPYAVAKARSMLAGDFTASFALKHAIKDAVLAVHSAQEVDGDLALTRSFLSWWQAALVDGAGDDDVSVVYRYAPK
jgi:3-hydroxyisobutyrate dehydrogenase